MDEETRALIEEAIALDDATRRDYECSEMRQRSAPQQLVYKTNEQALQPSPQAQSSTMDAATEARWNAWCDDRIAAALEDFARIVGEETGAALKVEIKKLCKEIGQLRADIEILRQHKANVTPIGPRHVA